jgi:hypothetical protein
MLSNQFAIFAEEKFDILTKENVFFISVSMKILSFLLTSFLVEIITLL